MKSSKKSNIKNENNKKTIILVLAIIIVLLISIIVIMMVTASNKNCPVCDSVTIKEVEVEPKYQLINFEGFKFKMPLNWNFVSNDNKYEIADNESKIFISLNNNNIDFNSFSDKEYQKKFLEELQTSSDIKIDKVEEKKEENFNYIVYYGTASSYNYLLVAFGNENKTILVNTQFVDKVAFDTTKDTIIDFVKSTF